MSSRKRRAPGASPQVPQQPGLQSNVNGQDSGALSMDPYLGNWADASNTDLNMTFGDQPMFDYQGNFGPAGQQGHNRIVSLDGLNDESADVNAYSNQLVRRNPNQQLTARGHAPWDSPNDANTGQHWEPPEEEDEDLEQKAIVAKKDAQTKRKQIPPFVQKLSSFLDNNKNENLIRWSDDGNSFIVLDEDEFARTLIPELFKHNNYASFVRQLNMYGFHKKVGLSDNSMKASETKAKAPSEYYNKYFKRGRSELLWLIQKPKNPGPAPKRKRDDDIKQGDSDEERRYAPDGGGGGSGNYGDDRLAVRNQSDVAVIPKAEYNNLRSEVRALQQQQKVISNILTQIKQQNDQLYRQAEAFRNLHDRHENSISAILTFLATFYNRSVEANGGANIADLFAASNTQQQPQGSVVDIGDYPDKPFKDTPPVHRPARRPLALLPAPTQKDALSPADRAATISPSIRSAGASPIPKSATRPQVFKPSAAQASTVPPASAGFESQGVSDRTSVPIKIDNTERLQPSDGFPEADEVMSAIQNVNSSQPGNQSFDFPTALSNYQTQGGNAPLTQQERNSVLSLMANNTSAASPNSALAQNSNNALANPHPPDMPSLDQFVTTQAQLDMLQKMSETQGAHIHQLQERLQPLSPSGSIPGLSENSYFPGGQLDDLDLDAFTQGDDFFPDTTQGPGNVDTGDGTLPDLDFQLNQYANPDDAFGGFDGTAEESERKKVESVSSEATSPAMTVEEVDEDGDNKRTPKRRRK